MKSFEIYNLENERVDVYCANDGNHALQRFAEDWFIDETAGSVAEMGYRAAELTESHGLPT